MLFINKHTKNLYPLSVSYTQLPSRILFTALLHQTAIVIFKKSKKYLCRIVVLQKNVQDCTFDLLSVMLCFESVQSPSLQVFRPWWEKCPEHHGLPSDLILQWAAHWIRDLLGSFPTWIILWSWSVSCNLNHKSQNICTSLF